jgi:hypothetical protein
MNHFINNNSCITENSVEICGRGGSLYIETARVNLHNIVINGSKGGQGGFLFAIYYSGEIMNAIMSDVESTARAAFYLTYSDKIEIINTKVDNFRSSGEVSGILALSAMITIRDMEVTNVNTNPNSNFMQAMFNSLSETKVAHIVTGISDSPSIVELFDLVFSNVKAKNMMTFGNSKVWAERIKAVDNIELTDSFMTM